MIAAPVSATRPVAALPAEYAAQSDAYDAAAVRYPLDRSDIADIAIAVDDIVRVDATYGSVYEGRVVKLSATAAGWALVKIGRYCEWFSAQELTLLVTAAAMTGEGHE